MSTDIVVGIDGSENSGHALAWALDEAEVRGVRVRAVLAWSYMGQGDSVLGMGTTEEKAQALLDELIATHAGDRKDLVDGVLVNDLAVNGLLESAKDAALLVVGHRGHGRFKGVLLGSTSRTVVERSPIPVVVVPIRD